MRQAIVSVAALLALLAPAGASAVPQDKAQEDVLDAVLESAFEGSTELSWMTYVLSLTNKTNRDLDLSIVLTHPPQTRLVRRELLARNAKVKLQLFAPNINIYYGSTECEILDAGGRRLFHWKVDGYSRRQVYYNYGSGAIPTVLALTGAKPGGMPDNWIVMMGREAYLPQRSIGYRGLNFVYLRDCPLEMLVPAQLDALLEYVAEGGTVVLCPGLNPAWLTSDAVRQFADIKTGATELIEIPRELEEIGATGATGRMACTSIKNGRSILGRSRPLAVEFLRGHGRVIVVPFDLEIPPFDRWTGKGAFLETITRWRRAPGLPRFEAERLDAVAALPGRLNALPPFALLMALVTVFIVLVGPANFLILRKAGRPQLLLLTIPAVSAAFVLVVVITGYILRGASTVGHEVVLLEAVNGDALARQTRVMSLFSPASRTYRLECPDGETLLPLEYDAAIRESGYRLGQLNDLPLKLDQGHGWAVSDCPFAQWQARPFVGRSVRSMGRGVRVDVEGAKLTIANGSPWRIVRGFVVDGHAAGLRFIEFGELAAGATREFAVSTEPGSSWRPPLSPLQERVMKGWLAELGGRRLIGRVTLCELDGAAAPLKLDATLAGKSERTCLLQILEAGE